MNIPEETVRAHVINDEGSIYIPPGVRLASESQLTVCIVLIMKLCNLSPAPDTPDFLSRYLMPERTDYAEQTFPVTIDDQLITATRRIICYNQPIYDDGRLEVSEYAGLTLDVDDGVVTTVRTEVQDLYDFASIRILDDDSVFACSNVLHNCDPPIQPLFCSCPGARVGLERTFSEGVGVVELCVVVYEPDINCPIEFPFNVRLSFADGAAGMISCAAGLTSSALRSDYSVCTLIYALCVLDTITQ